MKIAVFSDSHGYIDNMINAVNILKPDMIIHLGDGTRDAERLGEEFPLIPITGVKGNCDFDYVTPEDRTFEVEGIRFFIAHGHRQNVKIESIPFLNCIYFAGAQIGLYGHTHSAKIKTIEDVTIMNPGTCKLCSCPTCGIITIENGEFECEIAEIDALIRKSFTTSEENE